MGKWNHRIKDAGIHLAGLLLAPTAFLSMNPVGIGFFAAVFMEKRYRLSIFAAMAAGMAAVRPRGEWIKYGLIMAVIAGAVSLIEKKKKGGISIAQMGILSAAVSASVALGQKELLLPVIKGGENQIAMAVLEGLLILALCNLFYLSTNYFLHGKRGQPLGNEELISMAVLLSAIVYSLPDTIWYQFSVRESVIYFFILLLGYKYGAGAGAILGSCLGLVMGLGSQSPVYIGMYCLLGICAGMLREMGRIAAALTFAAAGICLDLFYMSHYMNPVVIRGISSAAVVFIFIPGQYLYRIYFGGRLHEQNGTGRANREEAAVRRLLEFSDSFRRLSKTFSVLGETRGRLSQKEVEDIFEEMSDKLCSRCKKRSYCVNRDKYDSYQTSISILNAARERGSILPEDLPDGFARRCVNLDAFLDETNRELAVATINLNWQNRMAESREAVAGQLGEVADIIKEFTNEFYEMKEVDTAVGETIAKALRLNHIEVSDIAIVENRYKKEEIYMTVRTRHGRCITTREMAQLVGKIYGKRLRPSGETKNIVSKDFDKVVLMEDGDFKVLTGNARKSRQGEEICGDNFSFLNLESGEVVMMLSDGMGCGNAAYEESGTVIELLEEFLEAGFSEKAAIRLINSILVLRSGDKTFSTLDMGVLNLYTGVCNFIKIGASTTFIRRDGWVETIESATLPVGVFNHMDIDDVSKKLYNGDVIVMVSDGVMDSIRGMEPELYLEKLIREFTGKNPQEMADYLLQKVMEQTGAQIKDDMSILTAGIWEKF